MKTNPVASFLRGSANQKEVVINEHDMESSLYENVMWNKRVRYIVKNWWVISSPTEISKKAKKHIKWSFLQILGVGAQNPSEELNSRGCIKLFQICTFLTR